jgi:hypothetical protein
LKYPWVREDIASKGENRANFGDVRVGIHMPLLIAVSTSLVAFAFHKSKHEAVCIPLDVENVCIHNIL